jgi:hypothetical protein
MAFFNNRKSAGQNDGELKPREARLACVAFVSINGFEGEAILSNINTSGYRMESRTYAALTPGEHHIIQIKPEASSNLQPFEMEVEVRWIKSAEIRFSAGFLIIRRPINRSFEKYLEYARSRSQSAAAPQPASLTEAYSSQPPSGPFLALSN